MRKARTITRSPARKRLIQTDELRPVEIVNRVARGFFGRAARDPRRARADAAPRRRPAPFVAARPTAHALRGRRGVRRYQDRVPHEHGCENERQKTARQLLLRQNSRCVSHFFTCRSCRSSRSDAPFPLHTVMVSTGGSWAVIDSRMRSIPAPTARSLPSIFS